MGLMPAAQKRFGDVLECPALRCIAADSALRKLNFDVSTGGGLVRHFSCFSCLLIGVLLSEKSFDGGARVEQHPFAAEAFR